jgi:hypothetical protein
LKRRVAVLHFSAGEELLQAVVQRARQDHSAQDLPPLIGGQRRSQRLPDEKAVAGRHELLHRQLHTPIRAHTRRRIGQVRCTRGVKRTFQLTDECDAKEFNVSGIVLRHLGCAGRHERVLHHGESKWETFDNERGKASSDAGSSRRHLTSHVLMLPLSVVGCQFSCQLSVSALDEDSF